jgi:phage terminase small subunit
MPADTLLRGLKPATVKWVEGVMAEYDLEEHHRRLVVLAARSWDRGDEAREKLEAEGLMVSDKWGIPHAHPMIAVERDSRIAFARLLRELALDVEAPADSRPPQITRAV